MQAHPHPLWSLRITTFALAALAAASAAYWVLNGVAVAPPGPVAILTISGPAPVDPQAVARLLGGGGAGAKAASPAQVAPSRYTLTGVVGLDATQTLTNKTLTTPVITGGTVDGAPIGFRNIPPVGTKTSNYTLAKADVGEYVQIGSGGSITIPDAVFAEGDVVSLFNNTSGTVTITCSITTAYIGGADADKATMTLAARGVATILFISGTVCVVNGNVA